MIEFPDGLHEYVTTPVKRILRVCTRDEAGDASGESDLRRNREVYYLQTANSRYRLEIRSSDAVKLEAGAR